MPATGTEGEKFVTFDELVWHSDCFKCRKCGVDLVGKGFLMKDTHIACQNCAEGHPG